MCALRSGAAHWPDSAGAAPAASVFTPRASRQNAQPSGVSCLLRRCHSPKSKMGLVSLKDAS
eukprot:6201045-Pleurochrysis_carterae.AAC.1